MIVITGYRTVGELSIRTLYTCQVFHVPVARFFAVHHVERNKTFVTRDLDGLTQTTGLYGVLHRRAFVYFNNILVRLRVEDTRESKKRSINE